MVAGQCFWSAATTALTAATVSRTFAPGRLTTSTGEGGLAVEAGDVGGLLEGAVDLADVAHGDHLVAGGLDRQAQDVVGALDHAGQLYREGPLAGDQVAGRDQLVVAADDAGEVRGADAVGLHPHRIDGDLQDLVAAAGDVGAQDARQGLQMLLQGAGGGVERALRRRAGQGDADRWLVADVGLFDDRGQGVRREPAPRQVDLGADVLQHLVLVEVDLELQDDHRRAAIGPGVHLLEALDGLQLALQRPDQQALGVLRADPRDRGPRPR